MLDKFHDTVSHQYAQCWALVLYMIDWAENCRDHFLYAPSQWETRLQCNVISHWLGTYITWTLYRNLWPNSKARPPHQPQPSYPAPQGWLATPWTPLSCGMAGSAGGRLIIFQQIVVIQLHLNFKSVTLLMKNINMSIVYLFHSVFTVLEIKVALINCSWSKAPSKAA